MIAKIYRKLTVAYTFVIAALLLGCLAGGYAAYRYYGIKFLQEGLNDYLAEEVWEAEDTLKKAAAAPEVHKIMSDINSFHFFTFWFVDGRLILAEKPQDDYLASELQRRLRQREYTAGKIYHINVKSNKRKWYFMIIKQNIVLPGGRNGEVFAVANYSPLRNSSKNYVLLAVWGIMILVLSAYLIGRLLVSRSMKYIELTYEKQKQFVSNAAHELRTPLSVLLSYAELLEYKPGDKKLLAALKEEIAQMNGLIDHLLALARFENQMIPLQRQSIDLKELVTETATALSSLCPACPITVELPAEELSVMADRRMLRQLLNILLDNALKYTSAQKRIKVFLAKENRRVRITVADNGIGIKAQDLPHLFEKFWRADLSRNDKGLGLGLCLAEMIVTLHKGKIEVKSIPGQGSEFSVILPAEDKGLKNDTECRD